MDVGPATLGLAALAGLATTLSPCVLPILPVVAGAAAQRSSLGLVAMAAGLATAFTAVGVTVAASGQFLGLDERALRWTAGALMLAVAIVLLSERMQGAFAKLAARVGQRGYRGLAHVRSDHPAAQFGVGALMGVAWSPCVGPTLGAAIVLAANGESLAGATAVMLAFSMAAVVPLAGAGLLTRSAFLRRRDDLARIGRIGRRLTGFALLGVGLLVVTGLDKQLEAWVLAHSPDWLVALSTRV